MNLKKILIGGAAGALLLGVAFIPAFANYGPSNNKQIFNEWPVNHNPIGNNGPKNASLYNPGNELSNSKCSVPTIGKPIINVTQKVQNDPDSGIANWWAFDYFTRQITVWKTGTPTTYCAVLTYNGNFYAVPGQLGPQSASITDGAITTPADEPINGPFSGGERTIVTLASLKTIPSWTTSGSVPTTNYQGKIDGTRPGYIYWQDQYFNTGWSSSDDWFGFKYNGGSHGTWINSSSPGNSGNIL